jgi:hypothetical protein
MKKLKSKNTFFLSSTVNKFFINVYKHNGFVLLWAHYKLSCPKKKILCGHFTEINMAYSKEAPQLRYKIMTIINYQRR